MCLALRSASRLSEAGCAFLISASEKSCLRRRKLQPDKSLHLWK